MKHTVSIKIWAKPNKYKPLGYSKETIGYYFYLSIKLYVFFLRHVAFLGNEIFYWMEY